MFTYSINHLPSEVRNLLPSGASIRIASFEGISKVYNPGRKFKKYAYQIIDASGAVLERTGFHYYDEWLRLNPIESISVAIRRFSRKPEGEPVEHYAKHQIEGICNLSTCSLWELSNLLKDEDAGWSEQDKQTVQEWIAYRANQPSPEASL